MSRRVVSWHRDLGDPDAPGTVFIQGVGEVNVRQENIDNARELGGQPDVELIEVTSHDSTAAAEYIVGLFRRS